MPIPQPVAGQLLDVRRQLAFRDDVEVSVLVLFDGQGEELARIDHFWHVLPPRIRFGDSYESVQFLVVEDETPFDSEMAEAKTLKYIMATLDTVPIETFSPAHRLMEAPKPPLGRNKKWDIKTTTEANVSEFFKPPGT